MKSACFIFATQLHKHLLKFKCEPMKSLLKIVVLRAKTSRHKKAKIHILTRKEAGDVARSHDIRKAASPQCCADRC